MTMLSNRQQRRRLASLLFLSTALLTGVAAQADLPPIRQSRPVGDAPPPTTADAKPKLSLEARVDRLERLLQGQALVDMMMKIDNLQTEVQELRGQNEVFAHEIEGMKKRQRDLYLDIDRRLRQATESAAANGSAAPGEQTGAPAATGAAGQQPSAQLPGPGGAAAATPTVNGSVAASQQPAPQQANVDPQAEQAAYLKAFDVLKDGHYEDSITEFNRFLQTYPNGQYADNANYWIGEANYVLRRFPAAIQSFKHVTEKFPNSPKLADAKLKIGYSYYELKEWDKARKELEEVVQTAPSSTAAQLAANRLRQMKVEGH